MSDDELRRIAVERRVTQKELVSAINRKRKLEDKIVRLQEKLTELRGQENEVLRREDDEQAVAGPEQARA